MKKIDNSIRLPYEIKKLKKESLDQLCLDKNIHEFMVKHELRREMMDDYWIELINFQEDYQMCQGCRSIEQCQKNTMGYQMHLQFENNRVLLSMSPCVFEQARQLHLKTLATISPCNMPMSIFDIPLEKLVFENRKDVLVQCQKLLNNLGNKGIYLYGPMENGKTTIIASLIYKLASKGIQCGFISVPGLISQLKEQFSGSDHKTDLVYQLKTVPVLVLDDIGGENVSAWSRDEILSAIVTERAMRKLPTFFTSVYSIDELKKYYGLTKQKGDTIKVERLIEKMKAVSMIMELKSSKFNM